MRVIAHWPEARKAETQKWKSGPIINFPFEVLAAIALAASLGIGGIGAGGASAQETPRGFEKLARALAAELEKAHVKRVAIFDLDTADWKQIPFGSWLADQISAALRKSGEPIEVADRERLSRLPNGDKLDPEAKSQLRSDTAKSLGADAFVDGTFGALGDGVGITLDARHVGGEAIRIGLWEPFAAMGKIPLDDSVKSHLDVPIESLRPSDGVYALGVGGVGLLECLHCPQPTFSGPGVQRHTEGLIAMSVIVSTEGRVVQLDLTKRVGMGFDEQAAKIVRTWQFKPARDADGNPLVVRQRVEVTYKFF